MCLVNIYTVYKHKFNYILFQEMKQNNIWFNYLLIIEKFCNKNKLINKLN